MADPIDDYLDGRAKSAAVRTEEDMQFHAAWKSNPTKQNLSSLLKRFEPDINRKFKDYRAPAVPEAAFKMDLKKNAIKAFETYEPDRGASLRTHVNNLLRRSQRYNLRYQNIAFIPEEKAALITPIMKAKEELTQTLGAPPSYTDLSKYLNRSSEGVPKRLQGRITPKLVQTVEKYQIKDIPEEGFESDPINMALSPRREIVGLLRNALKGDEQIVFDYLYGQNNKPMVTSTGAIAKRMGRSSSQISRIKRRIEETYRRYA
jgi:DNA-directed RNA polymerase specialized sigma subunit